MKKVLVLSDSHGRLNHMSDAIRREEPDMLVFLGDGLRDLGAIAKQFPQLKMEYVPGNCDLTVDEPATRVLNVDGFSIMICHGHEYGVKLSPLRLRLKAQEMNVDAALFGHTHRVFYEHLNGVLFMNPGSIGNPPYQIPPSYGLLYLDETRHEIRYDVKFMEEVEDAVG